MMQTVVLTLKGPMVSWGSTAIGDNRESYAYPTASAVIGLLGACLGIDRRDHTALDILYSAWDVATFTLYKQQNIPAQAIVSYEFQTAMDSLKLNGELNSLPVLGYKAYYQDMVSSTALILREGQDKRWLQWVEEGFKKPTFTPYLGRLAQAFSEYPEPECMELSSVNGLETALQQRLIASNEKNYQGTFLVPAYLLEQQLSGARVEQLTDRRQGWRKYYSQNEYWLKEIKI